MCPQQTWVVRGRSSLLAMACSLVLAPGCRTAESPGQPTGGAEVPTQSAQLLQAHHPSVATLSADGQTLYLVAMDDAGVYQIYRGPVGTPPGVVPSTITLSFPVSILVSADDSQLVIVDYGDAGGESPTGAVYAGPIGGALSRLGGTAAPTYPTAGVLAVDQRSLFVTGRALPSAGGEAMLWQVPLSGGDAVSLHRGAPLSQPIGLSLASDNTLYVADAQGAQGQGGAIFARRGDQLLQINKQPLALTYPSGLSAAGRGSPDLLFTTTIATGTEPWLRRISPNGALQDVVLPMLTEATSLSRAQAADRWVAIDAVLPGTGSATPPSAGAGADGAVLLLSP